MNVTEILSLISYQLLGALGQLQYFPWPGCNFTIGSIRVDGSPNPLDLDIPKTNYYRGNYLVVCSISKINKGSDFEVRQSESTLNGLCPVHQTRLSKGREGVSPSDDWLFPHWLGFSTIRCPLRTSVHHHFLFTMVSLQSAVRWWPRPLNNIYPILQIALSLFLSLLLHHYLRVPLRQQP